MYIKVLYILTCMLNMFLEFLTTKQYKANSNAPLDLLNCSLDPTKYKIN